MISGRIKIDNANTGSMKSRIVESVGIKYISIKSGIMALETMQRTGNRRQ
jgi:hypothetical protein